MKTYTSKHITKEIRTYKINSFVDVVEVYENGKKVSSSVSNKNEVEFGPKYTLNKNCWMMYIDRTVLNNIINNSKTFSEFEKSIMKNDRKNLASYLIKNEDKDDDFVFWYSDGHVLFDHTGKPISTPLTYDYCGGASSLENSDEYFKIIEVFKTHPYIKKIETETIPYYNRDFDGQKGIKFCTVLLPQDKYEELYEMHKEDEYFCVRMHDEMKWQSEPKVDLFGVADLMKKHFEKKYQ